MSYCISFGRINKNYKYIIYAIVFGLLNNSISGINYYNVFKEIKVKFTENQGNASIHILIHQIFYYFGTFLLSSFLYRFQKGKEEAESKKFIQVPASPSGSISLIHTHLIENYRVPFLFVLLIIFLLLILEQVIEKYNCTLSHLDFWMFELIIISYLNANIFKMKIYKHHKFVIFFNLLPISFKIFTIYLSFKFANPAKDNNPFLDENDAPRLIYVARWYWIIIGLVMYFPLIFLRSYSYVKIKFFMDFKYISIKRILSIYGIIGGIFYSIICIITTFKKCSKDNIACKYLFSFSDKDSLYFASFKLYFQNFKNYKDVISEIAIIIIGIVSFFLYKYYSMMIIKSLSPVHLIFLSPIYFIFFKLILVIYNLFYFIFDKKSKIMEFTVKEAKYNFFLDISGDIFSIIGFLIYLEIFILNCCGLNYDSRKNIDLRSRMDSLLGMSSVDMSDMNDSMIEEEDENVSGKGTNKSS